MKRDAYKYYAQFSVITTQMGVIIFAGAKIGKWLDSAYPMEKNWFTIILTIFSVILALIITVRQFNKLNNN